MDINNPITRKKALKRLLGLSGALAAYTIGEWSLDGLESAWAGPKNSGFIVEGIGKKSGYSVKELTRKVIDAAGGMKRFVSRGDVVVIKPNISWARRPELAATTNPEILETVIELCFDAGAGKVRIADNTIHDARRCFAITGAGKVAKKTNADLVFPRSSLMKRMKIHGNRLDDWPVFVPFVEADKIINLPIAKSHSASRVTLGMKNWMGAVSDRHAMHQDLHTSIADLARFFKPAFTLIDAIRIMKSNGPSGGRLSDVAVKNTLFLSDDQVAVDARAALLFGLNSKKINYIFLADKWGIGTADFRKLKQKKVIL